MRNSGSCLVVPPPSRPPSRPPSPPDIAPVGVCRSARGLRYRARRTRRRPWPPIPDSCTHTPLVPMARCQATDIDDRSITNGFLLCCLGSQKARALSLQKLVSSSVRTAGLDLDGSSWILGPPPPRLDASARPPRQGNARRMTLARPEISLTRRSPLLPPTLTVLTHTRAFH